MNKRMRELQDQILQETEKAKGYMVEGEGRDLVKAEEHMNKVDALQKEFELEERMEKAAKAGVPAGEGAGVPGASGEGKKADGFKALGKMVKGQALDADEKAMIVGGSNGENYLIPEDVRLAINELRKSYISAKNLVTVETTDALTGSVNYEIDNVPGLVSFEDGAAISEADAPKFERKTFKIKHFGKLIPVSRILLGAEKAGLLNYINRWFLKNAIVTENKAIFDLLTDSIAVENGATCAGWKELKQAINTKLDPSALVDAVIVTTQSGFAALDAEEDKDGRPVLQANPAHPTQKLFQGLPVHVFPDGSMNAQGDNSYPMLVGSLKAAATFVEHQALEFATSEHYGFGKNQSYLRVIEGFDVMKTDHSAYFLVDFSASV